MKSRIAMERKFWISLIEYRAQLYEQYKSKAEYACLCQQERLCNIPVNSVPFAFPPTLPKRTKYSLPVLSFVCSVSVYAKCRQDLWKKWCQTFYFLEQTTRKVYFSTNLRRRKKSRTLIVRLLESSIVTIGLRLIGLFLEVLNWKFKKIHSKVNNFKRNCNFHANIFLEKKH